MKKKLFEPTLSLTLVGLLLTTTAMGGNENPPGEIQKDEIQSSSTVISEHSSSVVATGALPDKQDSPDFNGEQNGKIHVDELAEGLKAQNLRTFDELEKQPINAILEKIMQIIESSRDGVSKMRIAAYHLQELLNIHQKFKLGSEDKMEALKSLYVEIKKDLRDLSVKERIAYGSSEAIHEISTLFQDKYDVKIKSLLKDYFVDEMGMVQAYGAGVFCVFGAEFRVGKLVSATGRRYSSFCVTASTGLQIGLSAGQIQGKTKTTGEVITFASEKAPFQIDTFISGYSKFRSTSDQDDIRGSDYVMGLRAGMLSMTKPFKLPFFGRDFRYLRERLGLVANP